MKPETMEQLLNNQFSVTQEISVINESVKVREAELMMTIIKAKTQEGKPKFTNDTTADVNSCENFSLDCPNCPLREV